MKYIIVAFFIMTAAVSAQEYWTNPQLVWDDGSGLGQIFDPCLIDNSDQILISMEEFSDYKRIYLVTGVWQYEPFFPDSIIGDGHDDTPFMTNNGNTVYFSSDRSGGQGGFDIWVTENIDGNWTLPVNLGPNINTDSDEISPTLTMNNSELFFIRGNYYGYGHIYYGIIMRSEFASGQWQSPVILPGTINSDSQEYSPSISGDGSKLYFISHRENNLPGETAIWVSQRTGNQWGAPYMPDGCLNEYWQQCPPFWIWFGHPMSVCIGADGTEIVYVKSFHFQCFEANSLVYIAELITGIDDVGIEYPADLFLTVYPNPFNPSVNIQVSGFDDGTIEIYDILGREIRDLGVVNSGDNITWDGEDSFGEACPSGIYFVRLKSGERVITRNITLIR